MLKVGDIAPDFEFVDNDGTKSSLHKVKGQKIIYFFPKAFTAGCTRQSCSIRDNFDEIKNNGVEKVFGISQDDDVTLKKFAEKYNLNFNLVSDKTRKISKDYGVDRSMIIRSFSDRSTFFIDDENKISRIMENGVTGRRSNLGLKHNGEEIVNYLKLP